MFSAGFWVGWQPGSFHNATFEVAGHRISSLIQQTLIVLDETELFDRLLADPRAAIVRSEFVSEEAQALHQAFWLARAEGGHAEQACLRRVEVGLESPRDNRDLVRAQQYVAAQNAHLASGRKTMKDIRMDVRVNGDSADTNNIAWVAAENAHLDEIRCTPTRCQS
jgi:hypothetical protein